MKSSPSSRTRCARSRPEARHTSAIPTHLPHSRAPPPPARQENPRHFPRKRAPPAHAKELRQPTQKSSTSPRKRAPSHPRKRAPPTHAKELRHTHGSKIRHTRASKLRHTRPRRGYLAEHSTAPLSRRTQPNTTEQNRTRTPAPTRYSPHPQTPQPAKFPNSAHQLAPTYQDLPNPTTPSPSDQIGNSPKPTAAPRTPPATATYQNLPTLTTSNPSDQIENSPKPAASLPDPARRRARTQRDTRAPSPSYPRSPSPSYPYSPSPSYPRLPSPSYPRSAAGISLWRPPGPLVAVKLRTPLFPSCPRPFRHSCAGRNLGSGRGNEGWGRTVRECDEALLRGLTERESGEPEQGLVGSG